MSTVLNVENVPNAFLDAFFQNRRRAFVEVPKELEKKFLQLYKIEHEIKDPDGSIFTKMKSRMTLNHGYTTEVWDGNSLLFTDDVIHIAVSRGEQKTNLLLKVRRKHGVDHSKKAEAELPEEFKGKLGKLLSA